MNSRKLYAVLLSFFLLALLVSTGCTSTDVEEYEEAGNASDLNASQKTSPQEDEGVSGTKKKTKFGVGERAVKNGVSAKVNWVKWVKHVNSENEFTLSPNAPSDKKYVILDITLENHRTEEAVTLSPFMDISMELQDKEGYTYGTDYLVKSAIEKAFTSGDIKPGGKRRGRILFEVPRDSEDLDFNFQFEFAGPSTIATFDLPNKELRYSIDYKEKPEPKANVEIVSVESDWTEYDSAYVSDSGTISGVEYNLKNTGNIAFTPKVGIEISVFDEVVHSSKDATMFSSAISSGSEKTNTLSLYQSIDVSGEYEFKISIRQKGKDTVLASDTLTKEIG